MTAPSRVGKNQCPHCGYKAGNTASLAAHISMAHPNDSWRPKLKGKSLDARVAEATAAAAAIPAALEAGPPPVLVMLPSGRKVLTTTPEAFEGPTQTTVHEDGTPTSMIAPEDRPKVDVYTAESVAIADGLGNNGFGHLGDGIAGRTGDPDDGLLDVAEPAPADTREAWMIRAVAAMRPWFPEGHVVPDVRISVGWPGGRAKENVRGQCWPAETVADSVPAIFVAPDQDDPVTIVGIILHEMIHAAGANGHRSSFAKMGEPLGFLRPWTTSEGKTPDLIARITALLVTLGAFPHSKVDRASGAGRPPTQGTRMLKVSCDDCGYTVRTTAKWLAVAIPFCPVDDIEMTVEVKEA